MPEAVVVLDRGSGPVRYCHVFTEKHYDRDKIAVVKNKWPFRFDYVPDNVPKIKQSLENIYLNVKDSEFEYGEILHVGSARLDLDRPDGINKMNACIEHVSINNYELFEYQDSVLDEWDIKKIRKPLNFLLLDIH